MFCFSTLVNSNEVRDEFAEQATRQRKQRIDNSHRILFSLYSAGSAINLVCVCARASYEDEELKPQRQRWHAPRIK